MGKRSALKKHIKEALLFKQRIISAVIFVAILILILLSRLIYLQLIQHQFFSTLSLQNLLSIIPLKPSRGIIYDRNGIVLAKNVPSYSLALVPEKVTDIQTTITKLKKFINITDDDIKQFNRYRYQYRQFNPVPLKMKLSEEEMASFYVNQQFFPGVVIQSRSMRYYPLAETCSEAVGYVGRINQADLKNIDLDNYDAADDIGKSGIEKYYENMLHGKAGAEEAETNATGHIIRTLKKTPPKAGENIYLSIDSRLQMAAHQFLGQDNGAIVILKPDSGEILALVSHPSFDPNLFARGISQKEYQELLQSPEHPLFNRAIRGQYAAASTVKPFIALFSLDNGTITPETAIDDPGMFKLPNSSHIYHDWKPGGHGVVNFARAIEMSCDTFFYQLATHLGINQLNSFLTKFGFGNKTEIDLDGEESGLVPSPGWKRKVHHTAWYPGDTVETGIGQGFVLVTPLQLAVAVATLANRGTPMQPHLLYKSIDEEGTNFIKQPIEKPSITVQNPQSWDLVINAMQQVVGGRSGTATAFGGHHFTVAGKTGTAQTYGHYRDEEKNRMNLPKELRNHHLFIAFAPVENPEIAMAIILEHSTFADRIAGKLFNLYFKLNHENS